MKNKFLQFGTAGVLMAGMALVGCGGPKNTEGGSQTSSTEGGSSEGAKLAGSINGDGSSTVFPITEAVAEEFGKLHPEVKVTVGISGTGGGFKKFCAGETILQDASRPIKGEEDEKAKANGVSYIELPVAYDGLTVVVSKQNTWCKHLTTAELKKIWEPGSKIKNWSQVRTGFPSVPLKLYGPGTDSGTFDYFTEVINGKAKQSRSDYVGSEDDNVLVQGVQRDKGALGYFGLAYYEENKDKLQPVAIDGGNGPVMPSQESVQSHKYTPLSRPLFVYISSKGVERPEVEEFVKFYLNDGKALVKQVGFVPLPEELYTHVSKRFEDRVTGTMYSKGNEHKPLQELLASSAKN